MIDIIGLDQAAVLAALFNSTPRPGSSGLCIHKEAMTLEQAEALLFHTQDKRFEYYDGRALNFCFVGDGWLRAVGQDVQAKEAKMKAVVSELRLRGMDRWVQGSRKQVDSFMACHG